MKQLDQILTLKIEDKIRNAINEIKKAYHNDNRPWILGYSGGKDSTTTLQLVWYALKEMPIEERVKHIYVISSDTLVETPFIRDYLQVNHVKISKKAEEESLPLTAHILTPITDETFWVNLLGRGYPTPQQMFRWCTNRLKIKTSSRFIQEKISNYGEVVIVLGTRSQESESRAIVMRKLDIEDSIFSRSNQFSAGYSYSPIRDWSLWDVWQYLIQVDNPWGGDNQELAQMYRDAEGECPFIVDDKSPPCGSSRFGCWVCTLVEADRSVESLIERGETWLQPLLDFRNKLYWTTDPEVKKKVREYKLRRGVVLFKKNYEDEIIRGPYKFEFRKELLKMLLETQKKVREVGPDPEIELITKEELQRIRQIWRTEEGDWEDSIPRIYKEVYDEVYWSVDDNNPFNRYDKELLVELSKKYEVPDKLATKLIDLELQTQGMSIRHSIYKGIDKIFKEEWRSVDEIREEHQIKKT